MNSSSNSLQDRLEAEFAEAWKPAGGESIVGELVAVDRRLGYDDKPYPILTIRTDAGAEFAVHAFHSVLRSKLAETRPKIGERLGIRYDGKRESEGRKGSSYHSYRLVIERAEEGLDWSEFAGDDEPVTPSPAVPSPAVEMSKAPDNDGDSATVDGANDCPF